MWLKAFRFLSIYIKVISLPKENRLFLVFILLCIKEDSFNHHFLCMAKSNLTNNLIFYLFALMLDIWIAEQVNENWTKMFKCLG